jgi:hypothetical protein
MATILKKENYGLTPEGLHRAIVYSVEEVVNSFSGEQQFQIVFQISGFEEDFKLVDWFNPTLNSKSKLTKLLRALRRYPEHNDEFDISIIQSCACRIKVKHQEKKGGVYANPVEYLADNDDILPFG